MMEMSFLYKLVLNFLKPTEKSSITRQLPRRDMVGKWPPVAELACKGWVHLNPITLC
jgi:hypothetical protein